MKYALIDRHAGQFPVAVGALILWLALRWRRGENSGAQERNKESSD